MEQIYIITGNPFVDAGIYVISELTGKRVGDIEFSDLERVIPQIVEVYSTDMWKRMLRLIFTNNHPLVHSSGGGRERYEKFLKELSNDIAYISDSGTCISCGKRDKSKVERRFGIGRELVPLTGSAEFVNFFPMGSLGLEMCSACLLAIQFMPISLHYCAGRFLLLHSSSEKVMKYWAKIGVENFDRQRISEKFTGCYSNNSNDPVNSLFRSIEDIVLSYEESWGEENAFIRFYYFSNAGRIPAYVEIFDVPSSVFRFIVYVKQIDAYADWREVVNRAQSGHRNEVYSNLLNERSIVKYFFKGDRREVFGNWNLLKFYLKEVREMEEKRINAIREFSDRIAELIKSLDSLKRLKQIEVAKDYAEFRNVLRFLIKDSLRVGLDEPILKFDGYVELILPDGAKGWSEVRDLMLFRIYEVLHKWLIERWGESEESIEQS